jgi:regulator of protease activity HflC (stomatin/prohibitin superfamily)
MITGIFLFLTVVFTALYFYILRNKISKTTKNRFGDSETQISFWPLAIGVIIFMVGLSVSFLQPYKLTLVDSGEVALKVDRIGTERGKPSYVFTGGWVVYNVYTEQLVEYPKFQQHIDYDTIQVITKGGFPASIKPTFNYALNEGAIGDMFIELRKPINEIEQGWLKTAVIGSVNDVANRWEVDSIFNYREQFELAIVNECNKRVSKWFLMSQLRSNIVPPPALQNAIVNKTKSIQDAQASLQKVLVAEADGKIAVAKAKADSAKAVITASGDANAALITARADAEAIKLKQNQLSPTYVDYIKASRWDGALPSTVLGNSVPMITLK